MKFSCMECEYRREGDTEKYGHCGFDGDCKDGIIVNKPGWLPLWCPKLPIEKGELDNVQE